MLEKVFLARMSLILKLAPQLLSLWFSFPSSAWELFLALVVSEAFRPSPSSPELSFSSEQLASGPARHRHRLKCIELVPAVALDDSDKIAVGGDTLIAVA